MVKTNLPVKVYLINTGSCNGCDIEALVAVNCRHSGICFTKRACNIKEAKVVLVTGTLTSKSKANFLKVIKKNPKAKIIALGSCGLSTGVFRKAYAVTGPIDKNIKVDLYIAGCPPKPEAILSGIGKVLNLKMKGIKTITPIGFRGKLNYNPKICIGCLVCVKNCPTFAISAENNKGNLKLEYNFDRCIFCGVCQEKCPTGAIKLTQDYKMLDKNKNKLKTLGQTSKKFRRL